MGDYGERHQKRIKPSSYAHLPRGICRWTGIPAQGNETVSCELRVKLTLIPTYPPSRETVRTVWTVQFVIPVVFAGGLLLVSCTGFRSLHGCGAAGDFHPSSSHPSVSARKNSKTDDFYWNRSGLLLSN